jgi:hypothetical protein
LLASDDEWAAPIMAEVGPDGNVWVIDWYNYIVQHNPTPIGFEKGPGNAYMTDLRDKKHARIYRVVFGADEDGKEPRSLRGASSDQLVEALSSTNMFWRRHAQRLLLERGDMSVVPELKALASDVSLDPIGLNVGAIHALRTLEGLGALETGQALEILGNALAHPSSGVVRTAIEVLPRDDAGRDLLIGSTAFDSSDAQVRLSALLALAEMPASDNSANRVLQSLAKYENQNDRWMLDAATSAAATNGGPFLALACKVPSISPALRQTVPVVAEHMARSVDQDAVREVVGLLREAHLDISGAVIQGWANGWPKATELSLSDEADQSLVELLEELPASSKGQLIRLAKIWGSKKLAANADMIAAALLKIARDETLADKDRVNAADELIGLMNEDTAMAAELLKSITPRTPQATAIGMIDALKSSRAEGVGQVLLESMSRLTPATRSAAIRVLLARPETTRVLLSAIESNQIAREDLALDQQQALVVHPTVAIRRQAKKVFSQIGGLPSPDREKVLVSLMKVTGQTGDVERGKAVYVKNCANCHTHKGEGKKVGPDLTGMAVHPKNELLTQILDPSRSVEGNYRSYTVLTLDGIVISGMLASETQTAVEIFDAQGKKQIVLREDIEQLVASKKSVMPDGFEKQIDEQGFTDLLEFLTLKGKYLPLPLSKVATAISTKGLFHEGDNGADRLVFADWSPKMVGEIPFQLIDPQGKRVANIVLLHGPRGTMPPKMPKSVRVLCNSTASAIHLLSGVSGWGFPAHQGKTVSMTVRLHLADGSTEDHPLTNAIHFADYIRRVDVPGSEFAMMVRGQQLRHVVVAPKTDQLIKEIELIKGDDPTAPIVVAVTIEGLK